MNLTIIIILLTVLTLVIASTSYRGIRRGSARYYTLEREAILRRARLTLIASVFLFLGIIALLLFQLQANQLEDIVEENPAELDVLNIPTPTIPVQQVEVFPDIITSTPLPTQDPSIPEPTATRTLRRAIVEGTAGAGLTLRDTPGGDEVRVLADGTFLTLLNEPEVPLNGFTWVNVRTIAGDEGWVAIEFLTTN